MLFIPELLEQLTQHLDAVDLARCVQVSHMWSQVFTPSLWGIFDDSIEPWASMAQSFWQPNLTGIDGLSTSKDKRKVHLGQFARNCHHITHLIIHHAWTLELCLAARLTGLVQFEILLGVGVSQITRRNHLLLEKKTLLLSPPSTALNTPEPAASPTNSGFIYRIFSTLVSSKPPASIDSVSAIKIRQTKPLQQDGYTDKYDLEREDPLVRQVFKPLSEATIDGSTSFELLPNTLFSSPRGQLRFMSSHRVASTEMTEKCWQLVYNNRATVKRLSFGEEAKLYLCPAKSTTDIWNNVLSRLTRLEHLDVEVPSHVDLLRLLPTWEQRTLTSYVCDTDAILKLMMPPGFVDIGLRSIKIPTQLSMVELKAMFGFWPNLEHLHLRELKDNERTASSYDPTSGDSKIFRNHIVQEKIRTLELESPAALLRNNIQFPGLQSLSCRLVPTPAKFRQMLQRFPVLESATLGELDSDTPVWVNPSFKDDEDVSFPLKFLTIHWSLQLGQSLSGIIEHCPCLVEIKLAYGCPNLLSALGKQCRSLRKVALIAYGECSKAAVDLLINCPQLTEVVCQEMRIHVDDILASEPWTCVGLRKLRCEIVGIPRLDTTMEIEAFKAATFKPAPPVLISTTRQHTGGRIREGRAERQQSDPVTSQTPIPAEAAPTTVEGPMKRELSEDEIKPVALSRTVQHKVFSQFAHLTRLKELHLGFMETSTRTHYPQLLDLHNRKCAFVDMPVPDTLEFSLESGLGQLASLRELRSITIKGNHHMIRTTELDWMAEHWPMLRLISGVDRFGYQLGIPGRNVQELKEHMKKIQPKIEVSA
ncbi:hypothetical protein CPC16_000532 [Podila verticillata]|nr:hypothetical protein CPC16_000532 [Podila verticillata]